MLSIRSRTIFSERAGIAGSFYGVRLSYWTEDHPRYARRISHILDRITERGDTLCTSTFTPPEVLIGPYKRGDERPATQIRAVFKGSAIEMLPFTNEAADVYARIRATFGFSPADAIHLASAAESKTDVFLRMTKP